LDLPEIDGDKVLIKMLAAPINPADLNMIQGTYGVQPKLPAIGGSEGVGIIEQVGPNVKHLKVGQHVIPAKPGLGTWRTALVAQEDDLEVVDKEIPIAYASVLAINPCTAWRLIHDFEKLKAGDVIIQNGANSIVGTSVIQMAHSMGIKTINIIRPRPNEKHIVERLKMLGGDVVVNEEYATSHRMVQLLSDLPKPKLALNCIGGDSTRTLLKLVGKSSTMVTYGGMSRKPITIPTSPFIFEDITLKGFWLTKWVQEHGKEERKEMLDAVSSLIKQKKLTMFLETHKFSEFQHALKTYMEPYNERKMVIDLTQ
jgi:trans-2-enoyl-CoA reductase